MTQVDRGPATGATPGEVAVDLEGVQRRTVRTLFASQICGGMGLVSGYAVTALLADDLTGSETLAGLSAASLSIGAALASFPLARIMARSGRRPGLRLGYLLGAVGALSCVLAAVTGFFPLLPLGVAGIGAGNAANLATRYAAADLAQPERRARTIGLIVWATTIGSGVGSLVSLTVFDPAGRIIGLPDYGGSFAVGGVLFVVGAVIVERGLRPDPLVLAGGVGATPGTGRLSFGTTMGLILRSADARLAVLAMMISQATMVGTMTLTPLHMKHGGQSTNAIGVMLFSHILGMYAFSPFIGQLTDRFGRRPMLLVAGLLCTAGAMWAGSTPGHQFTGLVGGQTLVGLAWGFGIIAASGLLTESFPVWQRASIQGAGDLCMAAFGASAGIAAGAIVAARSYRDLNMAAAALGIILVVAVVVTVRSSRPRPTLTAAPSMT